MNELSVKTLSSASPKGGSVEIIDVHYDLDKLIITVALENEKNTKLVVFENVSGFRALDEGDLFSWWKNIGLKNGWAFEVIRGGWIEFESQRGDFMAGAIEWNKEYLVIGCDLCVSVISSEEPEIVSTNYS